MTIKKNYQNRELHFQGTVELEGAVTLEGATTTISSAAGTISSAVTTLSGADINVTGADCEISSALTTLSGADIDITGADCEISSAATTLSGAVVDISSTGLTLTGMSAVQANLATAAQTLADGVAADVVFNNEVVDALGEYDNATGQFTPTTTGWYAIDVSLATTAAVPAAAGNSLVATLYDVTGTAILAYLGNYYTKQAAANEVVNVTTTIIYPLVAGNVYSIQGLWTSGAANIDLIVDATTLRITRIR